MFIPPHCTHSLLYVASARGLPTLLRTAICLPSTRRPRCVSHRAQADLLPCRATPNSSKLLKLVTPPPVPRHPARLGNPRQLHDGASSPRSLVQHFDGTLTSVRATPSTRPRGRPRLHMQRYSSLPDPCANASSILCPSFRATSEELHDHPTLIALDRTHFPASPTRRSSRQMVARLYLSGSTQTHSTRTPQSCRPE